MKKIKKLPKIELNIVFSQHYNKEGLKEFEKLFKNSDVIFFENFGWSIDIFKLYNLVSRGAIKKKDLGKCFSGNGLLFNENYCKKNLLERLRIIHNSKKLILFPDMKKDSNEFKEFLQLFKIWHELSKELSMNFADGNFEKSIELCRKFIKTKAQSNKLRERIIKKEIMRIIENIRRGDEFKDKKKIKILGNFGRAHSNIVDELNKKIKKEDNIKIKKIISIQHKKIKFLSIFEEILRKVQNGKSVKKIDYPRAMFEIFLFGYLLLKKCLKNDVDKITLALKKISEKLSFNDIKKISEFKISNKRGFKKMEDFLKEKGLFIPKTKKELKQILGKEYDKFDNF